MTDALKLSLWERANQQDAEGARVRAALLVSWSVMSYEGAVLSEDARQFLTALLLDHASRAAGVTQDELGQAVAEICGEVEGFRVRCLN